MAVKGSRSAARALSTFEALARTQPVGVGELARALGDDKSAVQRTLMTLAEGGWIRQVPDGTSRWETTARVLVVAHQAQARSRLRRQARATLEALRDLTGETALLSVPDDAGIVVLDVVETREPVRTAPTVGLVLPPTTSAAAQAIMAYLPPEEVAVHLGGRPDAPFRATLDGVRRRGWALNAGDAHRGAGAVAAAVLDERGRPVASVAISVPGERFEPSVREALGQQVATVAARLSGPADPSVLAAGT